MAGLYFQEFEKGMAFNHAIRRTVTETDNILFTSLTHNPAALHLDHHYCETHTEFGKPLMNSLFTLGLMIGISVHETTLGTTVANLGMTEVRFPHPVFQGDTLHVSSRVLSMRDSRTRMDAGIVEFEHKCFNQHDDLVAVCKRQALMHKKVISPVRHSARR